MTSSRIKFFDKPEHFSQAELNQVVDHIKSRSETKLKDGAIEMRCVTYAFEITKDGVPYQVDVFGFAGDITIEIKEKPPA